MATTVKADSTALYVPRSNERQRLLTRAALEYPEDVPIPNTVIVRGEDGLISHFLKGYDADTQLVGAGGELLSIDRTLIKADTPDKDIPDTVRYIMTTNAVDRAGEVVAPIGANLRNFARNSVSLWSHNHYIPNVGKWVDLKSGSALADGYDGVAGTLLWHRETELSRELNRMAARGFLNACSIGFIPLAWKIESLEEFETNRPGVEVPAYADRVRTYTQWELIECSPCNVPMNPTALVEGETSVRRAVEAGVIRADGELIAALGENRINAGRTSSTPADTINVNSKSVTTSSSSQNPTTPAPTMKSTALETAIKGLEAEVAKEEVNERMWKIRWALHQLTVQAIESAEDGDLEPLETLTENYTKAGEMVTGIIRQILKAPGDEEDTEGEEDEEEDEEVAPTDEAKAELARCRAALAFELQVFNGKAGATLSKPNLDRVLAIRDNANQLLKAANYTEEEDAEKALTELARAIAAVKNYNDILARRAVEVVEDDTDVDPAATDDVTTETPTKAAGTETDTEESGTEDAESTASEDIPIVDLFAD